MSDYKIPSREAHNKLIWLIWKACILFAVICFVFMGGAVAYMKLTGHDAKSIVEVQLIIVYIILPAYALGYVAPTLATSLIKMSLGVEMSRQGLEIAKDTAETLSQFQKDTQPMIADTKAVISEIKPVIGEVKEAVHEGKKVFDDLVKTVKEGNGQLHGKIGEVLKNAVVEARKTVQSAEGDFEQLIWRKVDQFLATVFEGRQPQPQQEEAANGEGEES